MSNALADPQDLQRALVKKEIEKVFVNGSI